MKTFLITCPELTNDLIEAKKHLDARGIEFDVIHAIHGETFGLLPSRPYNEDRPGQGHLTPISQVGLTLSHYMTWQVCQHWSDEWEWDTEDWDKHQFLIMEADAKFPADWKERLDTAMTDLPDDWDIFLIGNSNTHDKEKKHICGDVWEVKYPFCTHAYMVRRKALPVLLTHCRDATMKIDLLMIKKAYPLLRVFTMLPRLVEQRGTDLEV